MTTVFDSTRRNLLAASLAAPALLGTGTVFAQQTYPTRQVRFIVPFPPGGPVDTTARAFAVKLAELWGQPTLVDNRAGAGGIVGAEIAAKLPADGYNLFVCSIHHSVLPSMRPKLPYDIEKDFVPVSFGAMFPVVLVAHPSLPAKNVAELIALAKKQPGKISFGSAGNGGGTHLAGELFNMHAGTQLQHVPYKGSAPAMTDLIGGQVQLMFSDAPTALPQIKAGKVRALGVASAQRSALLPDVPTIADAGNLPGYEAYSWAALVAPAGTPKDIVAKISADLAKVMSQADARQRLYDAGAEAMPTTPEEFGQMLKKEIAKWNKVVKAANIQMD
jgi:tripartite-type tricarboxylate transporter receptor subunit TctC